MVDNLLSQRVRNTRADVTYVTHPGKKFVEAHVFWLRETQNKMRNIILHAEVVHCECIYANIFFESFPVPNLFFDSSPRAYCALVCPPHPQQSFFYKHFCLNDDNAVE